MNQTNLLLLMAAALLLSACDGSSIDGKAQEEHYHNTDSMHTVVPAVNARSYSDPESAAGSVSKPGTTGSQTDSAGTAPDSLHMKNGSDTGTTNH